MKRSRGSGNTRSFDSSLGGRAGWALYLLALAVLVLPLTAGCSLDGGRSDAGDDTTASKLTAFAVSTTAGTAIPATTTAPTLLTTSTTLEAPSTTAASTTTTLPETTTTTLLETTTTTELPSTTTTSMPAPIMLYEITDWSAGNSGWAAAGQWKTLAGMLVTDGSSDSFAVAPIDLGEQRNYAIECEIQFLAPDAGTNFYLMARMTNGLGYWAGYNGENRRMVIGYGENDIADSHFVLDGEWHKYRLEIYDNMLKLRFEEAEIVRAMDNRALEAGTVGIFCGNGQINVRAFRVIAL